MEQHRTRPPQHGPRRGAHPTSLPPQKGRGGARPARPVRPVRPVRPGGRPLSGDAASAPAPRRMPNPRLTGLGCGLFCATVMLVLGALTRVLFGGSPTVYGVLFLPVCLLSAVWVRRGDLTSAPVVVPIGFAAGLVFVADGGDGFSGWMVGLATALATEAGWLYGGTLVTGVIVTVRKVRLMRRRRRVAMAAGAATAASAATAAAVSRRGGAG
ncbi:hypothetical protein KBY47_30855 [Streptomyces sp. B93]|nr:DUF6542 domain-containing protein [Streptomyces sp. B93]MBQ1093483.1 hypothetical protein [Streptomyces sp. B93]